MSVFNRKGLFVRNLVFCFSLDNEQENKWEFTTTIIDLKLSNGLSFYDDKLHVSESIVKMNNEHDQQIIRSYDFQTNQWIESATIHTVEDKRR